MVIQFIEQRLLGDEPGIVHRARLATIAGAALDDALAHNERTLDRLDDLSQTDLARVPGQSRAAVAAGLALDNAGPRQFGQNPGKQPGRDPSLGCDDAGRHTAGMTREIDQGTNRVAPLTTQFQSHVLTCFPLSVRVTGTAGLFYYKNGNNMCQRLFNGFQTEETDDDDT